MTPRRVAAAAVWAALALAAGLVAVGWLVESPAPRHPRPTGSTPSDESGRPDSVVPTRSPPPAPLGRGAARAPRAVTTRPGTVNHPPAKADDAPTTTREVAGEENHPPDIQGVGMIQAEAGTPVTLEVKGSDPDGDRISFAWDIGPCLKPELEQVDRAVVILQEGCDGGVATVTWTDEIGASSTVSWQVLRPLPRPRPIDDRNPPPESEDPEVPPADGGNRPPQLRGGGNVRPTHGQPVTLKARGMEPDGDRITHEWKFFCVEPLSTALDEARVQLKTGCGEGEAWLTWTDERGASMRVEWLLER